MYSNTIPTCANSLAGADAVEVTIRQNPWLAEPAKILDHHGAVIAKASAGYITAIGGQEEAAAVLYLRHKGNPEARSILVIGEKGYLNDNCFFAAETEVLKRQAPLWTAYHALFAHMKHEQAQQLLPNIPVRVVDSVLMNPFGFFAAYVMSGKDSYRIESIKTRNTNGIGVAQITATPQTLGPKYADWRGKIELKATTGGSELFISGPRSRRGAPSMTKKKSNELFRPFVHQAMEGKGALIYLIRNAIPIPAAAPWLLPVVQKCYFERVESLRATLTTQEDRTEARCVLENRPVDGKKETATMTIANDGTYDFNATMVDLKSGLDTGAPATGFNKLNAFAYRYAHFLRRAAPRP